MQHARFSLASTKMASLASRYITASLSRILVYIISTVVLVNNIVTQSLHILPILYYSAYTELVIDTIHSHVI